MADDYITDGLSPVTLGQLERLALGGALDVIVHHLKASRGNLRAKAFRSVTDWDRFNQAQGAETMLTKCIDSYEKIIREAKEKQKEKPNA